MNNTRRMGASGPRAQATAALAALTLVAMGVGVPAMAASDGEGRTSAASRAQAREEARAAQSTAVKVKTAAGLIITADRGTSSRSASSAAVRTLGAEFGSDVAVRAGAAPGTSIVNFGEFVDGDQAERLAAEVALLDGVASAMPDYLLQHTAPSPVQPNDPAFASQHAVWDVTEWTFAGVTWPVGGFSSKAPALWKRTAGVPAVVVAVIDTGSTNHPDLNAAYVPGYDFVSHPLVDVDGTPGRDANPADPGDWNVRDECGVGSQPSNSSWHGTHVAGIVGARSNNGIGIAGIAPQVRIQPVRVLGRCGGTGGDIADAIRWASGAPTPGAPVNATPAKVINLSLAGQRACDSYTQSAINTAVARGSTVVVAAGNNAESASLFTPANCSNVITVGSTDSWGQAAWYSNYGPAVTLSAPGGMGVGLPEEDILSTVNTGTTVPVAAGYAPYAGTSMAAPAVAGVAALLYSMGNLTPAQVKAALVKSVQPFPRFSSYAELNCSTTMCGAGLLDASKLAPIMSVAPTTAGTVGVGKTLTARPGTWAHAGGYRYQWLRNGAPISGATYGTYKLSTSDIGSRVSVRVFALSAYTGSSTWTNADSAATLVPKVKSTTKLYASKKIVKYKKISLKLTAKVSLSSGAKVVGKVVFKNGSKTIGTVKVKYGKAVLKVKKNAFKLGTRTLRAYFVPTKPAHVVKSTSKAVKVKVRK